MTSRVLHPQSRECFKSELDLFGVPCTQTSIEDGIYIEVRPLSSLATNSSIIDFEIPSEGSQYIDLEKCYIYLKVHVTDEKGANLAVENTTGYKKVSPVNNFLHSLFQQVDIEFGGKRVCTALKTYAYKACFATLLGYTTGAKDTFLAMVLWKKDDFNAMDQPDVTRGEAIVGSKSLELVGRLFLDVFMQSRLMLNAVDMRIKLIRSDDAFCLMADEGISPRVQLDDASLYIRKQQVSSIVLQSHAKSLSLGNAKMFIARTEVKPFPIPGNIYNYSVDNAYYGETPRRVIIGMVDESAYNGSYKKNPFNFQNYNIKSLTVSLNGQMFPSRPYQLDFNNNIFARAYFDLFLMTGQLNGDPTLCISSKEYKSGFTLFAFNFTPDMSDSSDDHVNLVKRGNLRIELEFREKLPNSIVLLLYAEFDNVIEIDRNRQIYIDY